MRSGWMQKEKERIHVRKVSAMWVAM